MRYGFILLLVLASTSTSSLGNEFECAQYARLAGEGRLPDLTRISPVAPWEGTHSPVATSENTLTSDIQTKILPFIRQGRTGQFQGKDGVPIQYHVYEVPNPKGSIVISHGRGDTLSHYLETIQNFGAWGYNTYFIEHRGHGGSGRLVKNPHKVHVERFQDYVRDFSTFMDTVVLAESETPPIVVGHSMGGLITTLYDRHHPGKSGKMVLITPMLQPKLKGIPVPVAHGILGAVSLFGAGKHYALGEKDFQYKMDPPTHPRQKWLQDMVRNGDFHAGTMGGSTFHWVGQALSASARGRRSARRLKTDTLVILAERDQTVDRDAILQFCRDHSQCGLLFLENAGHGPLIEPDVVRNQAMGSIRTFLSNDNNN